MKKVDVPPAWALLMALAAWALARWVPILSFDGLTPAGGALIVAGVGLVIWTATFFLRRGTPIEPRNEPRVLIADGPFRINRNPIYTGMTLVLVGWALILGGLTAFLPAALFPFVITRRFVIGEEALLRQAFGDEAERYLAATRRW